MADIQKIIDRILASPRAQRSNAFAGRVFTDEPILRRGSQMANYLPEPCRKMRELATSPAARTKPEAWVFYQQARLMESYTDDVEYHGIFEHYFPTYQAMNDRQLRGYFTWRTAVRAGDVRETSLSFVFVYLYELLCGIGTTSGMTGFRTIEAFWQAYRTYEPRLDRYVRPWLRDYAVWHGLDTALLEPYVDLAFDHALIALRNGIAAWEGRQLPKLSTPVGLLVPRETGNPLDQPVHESNQSLFATAGTAPDGPVTTAAGATTAPTPRKHRGVSAEDGADSPVEEDMFAALDTLSSYRPRVSRLWRERPDTLRHVSCAVVVRLAQHYDAHRKSGLMESFFGSPLAMPHEMFGSAVFWADTPHADAVYTLDEVNRYTCARGRWYWEGYHGNHTRSSKLGAVLRAVDQRLRDAIGYEHPLAEKQVPKYLAKIIDQQIAARLAWEREREAHTVHVDLSQLAGIRAAASATREALLIDEEREEGMPAPSTPARALAPERNETASAAPHGPSSPVPPTRTMASNSGQSLAPPVVPAAKPTAPEPLTAPARENPVNPAAQETLPLEAPASVASASSIAQDASPFGLTPPELALLGALLDGQATSVPAGTSLDMLVDDINEKLFELLGDTALEFDGTTPAIIEDYLEDVRGAIRP